MTNTFAETQKRIAEAITSAVNEIALFESGGGPQTWGAACRFAQLAALVRQYQPERLSPYARSFRLEAVPALVGLVACASCGSLVRTTNAAGNCATCSIPRNV